MHRQSCPIDPRTTVIRPMDVPIESERRRTMSKR